MLDVKYRIGPSVYIKGKLFDYCDLLVVLPIRLSLILTSCSSGSSLMLSQGAFIIIFSIEHSKITLQISSAFAMKLQQSTS